MMNMIVHAGFSTSLEDVTEDSVPLQTDGDAPLPPEPIRPLLEIRNLRTIYMCTWSPCAISDDNLCMMADAWPNLVSLTVQWCAEDSESADTPSLDCLPHLARSCPHLQRLSITYVALTVADDIDTYPVMSHCLSELSIVDTLSYPEEIGAEEVALLLDRIFPCLDMETLQESEVGYARAQTPTGGPGVLKAWLQVCRYLRNFQAVRMQERKRMEERNL